MKRIFLVGSLLLSACMLSAQSRYVEIEGIQECNGCMTYNLPHTALAVDLTVECETVKAGPYARYALKYLGLRAPFSDKTIHTLRGADVALFDENELVAAALPAGGSRTVSYGDEGGEFAVLPVDRTEIIQPSAEQAAQQAANRIFALRRSRLDLITGEAGENVFGEGLKAALAAIDSQEQALLELFLGKRTVSTETRRAGGTLCGRTPLYRRPLQRERRTAPRKRPFGRDDSVGNHPRRTFPGQGRTRKEHRRRDVPRGGSVALRRADGQCAPRRADLAALRVRNLGPRAGAAP